MDISNEIPFDIPNTWVWCRLSSIVNIKDSDRRPVSKEARIHGIYPYYGANGILDFVNQYIFDGNYILIGEDGSVMTKYGNPVVNRASGKIWVNNHAHIIEEYGQIGYFDYLYYALQSVDISVYVHGFMPKYSQGDLRKTLVPIPPLKEQHRIVSKLQDIITNTMRR